MDSPPPARSKKRKTPSPVSPPALTSPALPIPTAQATRRRLQLPAADAPRRSARRDPAQVAALAAERASAEAAKRRDADARSVAVDARRECARVRRLPPVAFDAGGAPADPSKAPAGLACWPLAPGDLEELRRVHDHVKRSIDTPIPWAGGSDERDTRWRGYGLLGDGRTRLRRAIRFHSFETAGAAKRGAAQESDIPNFKGSYIGRFPLVSADFGTSDHLSGRSRSVDVFSVTRARGTLTLKRR